MSGQFYGRWAPPKEATPKKQPSPAPSSAPSPAVTSRKAARESSPADNAAVETPKSIKKPKKRKRESQVAEQEVEEATSKKHKSILSKFEKVARKAEARQDTDQEPAEQQDEEQHVELHDLEPLPQPEPVPEPVFNPTFSTLPEWLEKPTNIEASQAVSFEQLGVKPFFLKKLEKRGFNSALAVQSALLPMLHTGYDQHLGDICVSAKTGSGKTLAYLLPIVEALKDVNSTALSAIVVVPSRKLVDQALQVAEELCAGTKIRVGTAVGSVPFATEQKQLVKVTPMYSTERAAELHVQTTGQLKTGSMDRHCLIDDFATMPADNIPQYESSVDILICTPGRLVEHIESTTGFLLRSIKWLVIDEADQLLNQGFQGWTGVLMNALANETPEDLQNSGEKLRKKRFASSFGAPLPPITPSRQVTKIVLSATMESDLNKLGSLKLRRPKLVAVHDGPKDRQPLLADGDVFELPSALDEFAIPVHDGSRKPLYLLYLLLHHVFGDSSDSNSSEEESKSTASKPQSPSIATHKSRVLVFTKSNESASRLSHLLSVLEPSLTEYLKTMTPSSTAKASKKLLRSFSSGEIKILVASDAASRGLDIPDLTHVVNYDMPGSITSYVHRVGRTARAGKSGEAWTLFSKTEAAWFWNQIAKGSSVSRGEKKVRRVELSTWNVTFNRKRTYEAALKQLQGAVEGNVETAE
ncbi:P-loop containing nucleoside triphosphate hydrolase protein [Corynespora cassiicola Philippines]|uniref:ATP-dependent RNA helicase n=1 Tax=Corynespora cassiicola Philippines TaxID=1448308 RepID=A0A2T2PBJ0_CORCC|nr:P-loop containing nucleoside triphosphate hydrolase protein [Corynespora cassiicola Philippines]